MSAFSKLRIPVALAPMAGVGTAELTAKACNAGIIGSIGAGMMNPDSIRSSIQKIRELAPDKPFAVNLFVVNENPEFTSQNQEESLQWVSAYCKRHGYTEVDLEGQLKPPYAPQFAKQFEALLDEKPPIASFTFGLITVEQIGMCHDRGIEVWGTATTVDEAKCWEKAGADAVILQGAEAGGHRGSFTTGDTPSAVPLLDLIESTIQQDITIPLIATGGIMNGDQIVKLIKKGAAGVQLGTLFLGASDSGISDVIRNALYGGLGYDTVLSRSFTGRWARGIENDFAKEGENQQPLPYPVQNKLTKPLRDEALKRNDPQSTSIWAGTAFCKCRKSPLHQIVNELEAEFHANL